VPEKLWPRVSKALLHDLPRWGSQTTAVARWSGILIVVTLAITGFSVGSRDYLDHQSTAHFYQYTFDVAVSIACTGHIDALIWNPNVDAFLTNPSGLLQSCEGVNAARIMHWTEFDASTLYLHVLAALAWVFLGFSWSSLAAIAGLFAAGFTVGAYLFIRCFTSSRIVAAGLALAVLFAPPALEQIPNLRDFSKAPLILLGLGFIGRAVLSATRLRHAILLAGSAGVLVGLGRGLRPDAFLLAPVALATFVLLWSGTEGWVVRIRQTLGALLAVFAGYLIASAPVAIVNASKHVVADETAHVAILGFAAPFQDTLGFERGNYALIRDYVDQQAEALVNLHHSGVGPAPISLSDPSYGLPSSDLLMEMLMAAPHDALMRVFATANALGAYPINNLTYGPALLFLLAVGLVLLPRRVLFYCISASVIVPALSLQFHPRHAFYFVVFGAAALGLAYTVAAAATVSLLNRTTAQWPSGPQILQRIVRLGGSMATIVVVVYAADDFARRHQASALVAQYQVYRDAAWSPIETVQDDAGVKFSTLTPTPEHRVGLMALSFAFPDLESTDNSIDDLDWQAIGAAQMTPVDEGFRITANSDGGYQFKSRPIEIRELIKTDDSSEFGTLSLRIRGMTDSAGWTIGVLSHDESKWIGTAQLPSDAFDRRVTVRVPRTEAAVRLVWEAAEPRASLQVDQLVVSRPPTEQGCAPVMWSIAPQHRFRHGPELGVSVPIPAAKSVTYYFPFAQMPRWMLSSVKIDEVSSRCMTAARIVQSLPTHTLPIELIEIDGAFYPAERLSWGAILSSFARWHRPSHYQVGL
jgi:hypothetical protein